jgi:hypothetical protein
LKHAIEQYRGKSGGQASEDVDLVESVESAVVDHHARKGRTNACDSICNFQALSMSPACRVLKIDQQQGHQVERIMLPHVFFNFSQLSRSHQPHRHVVEGAPPPCAFSLLPNAVPYVREPWSFAQILN